MLRIYCLQQWYNLSDPGAEEALYDMQSMRMFCNLELGRDPIPDETTILNFRHLLEAHELTKTVFEAVAEYLEARGAMLHGGTIVDATLIAASPSTKNEAGKRDPQMHSSKKGNQWYFGMKAHVLDFRAHLAEPIIAGTLAGRQPAAGFGLLLHRPEHGNKLIMKSPGRNRPDDWCHEHR